MSNRKRGPNEKYFDTRKRSNTEKSSMNQQMFANNEKRKLEQTSALNRTIPNAKSSRIEASKTSVQLSFLQKLPINVLMSFIGDLSCREIANIMATNKKLRERIKNYQENTGNENEKAKFDLCANFDTIIKLLNTRGSYDKLYNVLGYQALKRIRPASGFNNFLLDVLGVPQRGLTMDRTPRRMVESYLKPFPPEYKQAINAILEYTDIQYKQLKRSMVSNTKNHPQYNKYVIFTSKDSTYNYMLDKFFSPYYNSNLSYMSQRLKMSTRWNLLVDRFHNSKLVAPGEVSFNLRNNRLSARNDVKLSLIFDSILFRCRIIGLELFIRKRVGLDLNAYMNDTNIMKLLRDYGFDRIKSELDNLRHQANQNLNYQVGLDNTNFEISSLQLLYNILRKEFIGGINYKSGLIYMTDIYNITIPIDFGNIFNFNNNLNQIMKSNLNYNLNLKFSDENFIRQSEITKGSLRRGANDFSTIFTNKPISKNGWLFGFIYTKDRLDYVRYCIESYKQGRPFVGYHQWYIAMQRIKLRTKIESRPNEFHHEIIDSDDSDSEVSIVNLLNNDSNSDSEVSIINLVNNDSDSDS